MHLERAIAETEDLLDGSQQGITYAVEADWNETSVEAMRALCRAVREHIQVLVDRFALPVQRYYARRVVVAEMSTAWANLEDTRPERLRRYGEVHPGLGPALEPHIENLIGLVLELQHQASRESR